MSSERDDGRFDRRKLFKFGGGAAVALAGAGAVSRWKGGVLNPVSATRADANVIPVPPNDIDIFIGGTDGWISLPASPTITTAAGVLVHPDSYAPTPTDDPQLPPGLTTYIFGFRNITGLSNDSQANQKNRAQASAPLFFVDEVAKNDAGLNPFKVSITNLGLAQRPDLFDAHTLHWHGFRNVIPFFDGEPTGSVSVPAGSLFTYAYVARDPGTYMYHCHVEDVEHVHMGMTGLVFVHAYQDLTGVGGGATAPVARRKGGTAANAPLGYAYNDDVAMSDPKSTAFDREFAMFMSEVWAESHWADAHIQLPEWSDYRPDFELLNGRVYPDTLAPNGVLDTAHNWNGRTPSFIPVQTDPTTGDLLAAPGNDKLRRQPVSSLVNCNTGDRVLLRFANLGFKEGAMTMAGIRMRVIGRDATPMRGESAAPGGGRSASDSLDISYLTNVVNVGPGESYDCLFTAPAFDATAALVAGTDAFGPYNTYVLYNRNYQHSDNLANNDFGGQATEIRVHATGVTPQTLPNQDQ